jgi:hypothetical protein
MNQIYRAAARVVVRLGQESASTLLAFQFAERLAATKTLEEASGHQPDQLELPDPEARHVYEWHLGGLELESISVSRITGTRCLSCVEALLYEALDRLRNCTCFRYRDLLGLGLVGMGYIL